MNGDISDTVEPFQFSVPRWKLIMTAFSDWSCVFDVVPVKPITCAENEYACRKYMCVPEFQHCDGIDQCGDNSDEEH